MYVPGKFSPWIFRGRQEFCAKKKRSWGIFDSPEGVFIEPEVVENSPKSQNVLWLVQLGAPTMGGPRVQKRGAPAPPRPRGSQPGRENHGIPGVSRWGIGASEPDLSNGHLIFARVGVEFFANFTFRAVPEIRISPFSVQFSSVQLNFN